MMSKTPTAAEKLRKVIERNPRDRAMRVDREVLEAAIEEIEQLRASREGEMLASEAVFGFAGWLTSRDGEVTLGAKHHAGVAAELVDEFCKANKLEEPRTEWTKRLTHPSAEKAA